MITPEQYRDGISFIKYAPEQYSPDVLARVNKITNTSMFFLDLPEGDERFEEMIKLRAQFYARLKMDLESSGLSGGESKLATPQDILSNTTMYNFLVGSSENPQRWQSMGFDLHKPAQQYQYSRPDAIGLLEASYYLNAQSLGIEIDTSRISPDVESLFKTVNGIQIPAEPEI